MLRRGRRVEFVIQLPYSRLHLAHRPIERRLIDALEPQPLFVPGLEEFYRDLTMTPKHNPRIEIW